MNLRSKYCHNAAYLSNIIKANASNNKLKYHLQNKPVDEGIKMTLEQEEYLPFISETRNLVSKVVQKNMAEGILFSAGTDTTVIAYEAVKSNPDLKALTIAFEQGNPRDTKYVEKMVDLLKLKHQTHIFKREDITKNSPKVIKILKTFDPMEVRNSIPIYIGLTIMKKKGIKTVFTGDGLDELFGYPWQFHLSEKELQQQMLNMWAGMSFSSIPMAESLGIEVKQPYLDPLFMDWAKKLPMKVKINLHNKERFSKWIIRKSYEDIMPKEVIWRPKAPIEQGTGADAFNTVLAKEFTDEEFKEEKKRIFEKDAVQIRDKEQLFYYKQFRKIFGKPLEVYPDAHDDAKQCPQCKSYVKTKVQFCRVCGAYPI